MSYWIGQAIMSGTTAFVATNIDDLVILMLFFIQAKDRAQAQHIVLGQYLGFSALILASLPGFLGGFILPRPVLGLLGFLPILIGIKQLRQARTEDASVQHVSLTPNVELNPRSQPKNGLAILNPQTYQVAAVTFANGGDNIGIYIPLFANCSAPSLGIILLSFAVMIALWCGFAYGLSQHPIVARTLTRYGHHFVPFVLMGLGLFILIESKSYTLFSLGDVR